ncbi:hypothetical protein ACSXBA_10620 [Clostridium perfringens]|jgi:hypothetical protein|uniref:Uncharacterized protein n=1 Tax=Clostridium perfringens F262 TaxID=883064 RepID=A0AAV3FCY6_CLOPF|nr:hypothetical protein [Clostridium perfringens]STB11394.1 Uncharacterised protein [Clostridium novyi]AOY53702.1 hypothetical protein FORC25_1286 [Clostridium perfringens]EHK2349188.1 hypothetical protein [Clostridium perfringens]EIA17137.1 hypothetical protein HA1_08362 [Clostridium perfringens F262]EIF5083651.1 hypothetical protein [Clostridium perfringens]
MFSKEEMLKKAKEDKEHENSMTIFYSKFTGKIIEVAGGVQDFNYFIQDRQDKESYCLRAIYPRNMDIFFNIHNYSVNLETKKLIYTPVTNIDLEPISE